MDVGRIGYNHEMSDFMHPRSTVPALRWTAIVETASFVLLMVFVVLDNRAGIRVVGSIHGALFLLYVALVLAVRRSQNWSWAFVAAAIIGGPIGALFVPQRLRDPVVQDAREAATV